MRTGPINEFDKTTCTRMAGHALELLIADRSVGEHEERRYQLVVP